MSIYHMDEVDNIYNSSKGLKIKVHSVPSANLQTFNRNISHFLRIIGQDGNDDFWMPITNELKRFRFDLSAAPLSKEIISQKALNLHGSLQSRINYCETVYGTELAITLKQLAEQALLLSEVEETNLLNFLVDLIKLNKSHELAIVICETRLVPLVEETFLNIAELQQKCELISPTNLREAKCYRGIFVIGSPRWFPEYIFTAPRSKDIQIIKHKWISGTWNPELILVSPYKAHGSSAHTVSIVDESSDVMEGNPEQLIPRIDIKKIQDSAMEKLVELFSDDDDVVVAKLFLLENDWAVFLDADDDASVDIIDLDEEIVKRVKRTKVREVQSGMFILLRTEGGGDYIVPVADRIMGTNKKDKARYAQKRWKMLLREYEKKEGMSKTIMDLHKLGSVRASHMNVKHWMSFRGIKTESYDDFLAIMKLIGLENESQGYWNIMGEIRNAHTRAGFTIRSMLLDLVNKSDLDILKRYGKMDFELAEQGAGSLSAFRVIDVVKETSEVIHWRIGEPFRINNG